MLSYYRICGPLILKKYKTNSDHFPEAFIGQCLAGNVVMQDILRHDGKGTVREKLLLVPVSRHKQGVTLHLVVTQAGLTDHLSKTVVLQIDVEDVVR